jgi:transcriptional regulator with XRE-family HTH domain
MATLREKFGKRIKELRKKQGLTQEKLAELAKIDYSYLNLIEAGKRNPSLKRIAKLARILKVKLSQLFDF